MRPAAHPGARPPAGGWIASVGRPLRASSHETTELEFHISPVPSSSRPQTGVGSEPTSSRRRRARTWVVAQALGAGHRLVGVRDDPVPPATHLVAKHTPARQPAAPNRALDDLWVPDIRFTSCDLRVLMDQPTKAISSHDPPRRRQENGHAGLERWRLPQGAVRAVAVVMVDILGQHRPQLPAPEDEHPVQYLPPNRAHPALRISVRPRRSHRRAQHRQSLGSEDGVECGGELRVPVAD